MVNTATESQLPLRNSTVGTNDKSYYVLCYSKNMRTNIRTYRMNKIDRKRE